MSSLSFALVHLKGPILCLCPSTRVSTRIGVNALISQKKQTHTLNFSCRLPLQYLQYPSWKAQSVLICQLFSVLSRHPTMFQHLLCLCFCKHGHDDGSDCVVITAHSKEQCLNLRCVTLFGLSILILSQYLYSSSTCFILKDDKHISLSIVWGLWSLDIIILTQGLLPHFFRTAFSLVGSVVK